MDCLYSGAWCVGESRAKWPQGPQRGTPVLVPLNAIEKAELVNESSLEVIIIFAVFDEAKCSVFV